MLAMLAGVNLRLVAALSLIVRHDGGRWSGYDSPPIVGGGDDVVCTKEATMLRRAILLTFVAAAILSANSGCRSCSSCHDYDPPVANCGACGCNRAGSVSGGHVDAGYASDGYVEAGIPTGQYEAAPSPDESAIEAPTEQP
jgi:hypothetical protein